MDMFPDPMKPLSEKSSADLATEAWVYDEVTKSEDDLPSGKEPPPQEPAGNGSGFSGCGCVIIVLIILAILGLAIENCGGSSTTTYNTYQTVNSTTTTTRTSYTTEYRYTTKYRYTTRAGTTQEDFYGVHDHVDAADFADEMADEEFDGDWEEAYDYYEENY